MNSDFIDGTPCAVKVARTVWDGEKTKITSKSYLSLSVVPTVVASGYENLYDVTVRLVSL